MYLLLDLAVLRGFERSIDFKRERDCSIVELLGSDIDRPRTLSDLDPVLTEGLVGEDVYVTFVLFHMRSTNSSVFMDVKFSTEVVRYLLT